MRNFLISFFCITILLAISLKSSLAFIPTYSPKKQFVADQKDKSEKNESPEEEKNSKDDLKKNEFINCFYAYNVDEVSSKIDFANHDTRLPSIIQNIPKLPPRICSC